MRRQGLRYPAKESIRVREALLKRLQHLSPYFITTRADGRTQHGKDTLGLRTVYSSHLPHSLFHQARKHTTPAGMNCRHSSVFRVHQQQGHAIGGSNRQQDTGLFGQQRVTYGLRNARLFRQTIPAAAVLEFTGGSTPNLMDAGGMDLAERSQCVAFHTKLPEEKLPIFPYPGRRLALRESEVQPRGRTAAHATPAGTECMHQPGITADERVLNPGQPAARNGL
jgi:hypothetical protein